MDTVTFLNPNTPGFPALAREHGADAHLLVGQDQEIRARCSLWWTDTALHENQPIGAIGHYESASPASAEILLAAALAILHENNIPLAVGPLDGNTWRRYRLITEPGDEPPFFLEPENPSTHVDHFRQADFTPLAEYFSALAPDLGVTDPRLPRVEARLQEQGVSIRPLDPAHFLRDLEAIHEISRISFQENFLYTPLSRDAFIAQYLPIRDLIDPRLVLLAECENIPVGYVFAIPDFAQKKRGQPMNTVILKTVACLPGRRQAGLGTLLVGRLHTIARDLGWQRIIHALMHESNNSRNLSSHYATTMRRYTLFSRSTGK